MAKSIRLIFIGALLSFIPGMLVGMYLERYSLMKEAESYGYTVKVFLPGGDSVYAWKIVVDNAARD